MKDKKIFIYIALLVIGVVCMTLLLVNTVLYNYKGKVNNYLDT